MYQRAEINKKLGLWIGLVVLLALLLGGCAQPEVVEEVIDLPVIEAPVVEEEAYPVEEIVVAPEVAYPATEVVIVPETAYPVEDEPEIEESEEETEMLDLLSEKIGDCHALNFVLRQNKTREEWSTTIDRMIGYGAPINAEEKEIVIDFLVSREQ